MRSLPRRAQWAAGAAAAAVVAVAAIAASSPEPAQSVAAGGGASTSVTHRTTTTERQTTTTAVRGAPEGGSRSGTGEDLADGSAGADEIDRSLASNELLAVLGALTVQREHPRAGYERDLFPHWDDEDHDGCDTRCEVLAAQRGSAGQWLSAWDGYTTDDPSELQVDHVVALAEAWDSGADRWTAVQRDEFADHLGNLLAVSAAANVRKGDRDAAEWFPSRADANCLWASTVVAVKDRWNLSVDQAEADALGNLLRGCADDPPPDAGSVNPR